MKDEREMTLKISVKFGSKFQEQVFDNIIDDFFKSLKTIFKSAHKDNDFYIGIFEHR